MSKFTDFFRNANEKEKREIYTEVMNNIDAWGLPEFTKEEQVKLNVALKKIYYKCLSTCDRGSSFEWAEGVIKEVKDTAADIDPPLLHKLVGKIK